MTQENQHNSREKDHVEPLRSPATKLAPQNESPEEILRHITPKMAWQLAAPHTWPAAILPVLVAVAAASVHTPSLSFVMVVVLLVICILMQSAVNTFNDYYDYQKGLDSVQDNVDPTDAVLVYNKVYPRDALFLAIGFLVAAFALGVYVIVQAGWIPLVIALVGAAFVVLYSAGTTPISALPLGELVSGVVMGGLIPLACFYVLTGTLEALMILWALPTMIGVALIMFTNNTCDIEKDAEAGRRTLAVVLGRTRARGLYHALVYGWLIAIVVIVALYFSGGVVVVPFALLASYPLVSALLKNPLTNKARIGAMAQICSVNVALGSLYAAAIFAQGAVMLTW